MPFLALTGILALHFLPSAEAQTGKPLANRFLFIYDISAPMHKHVAEVQNATRGILETRANGQMRFGDTVGVWSFDAELHAGFFPLEVWTAGQEVPATLRINEFLRQQPVGKKGDLGPVMDGVGQVIQGRETMTIFLFSTGESPIRGTPFDQEINDAWQQALKDMKRDRMPIITVFQARSGKFLKYTVNPMPWPVVIPELPTPFQEVAEAPKPAESPKVKEAPKPAATPRVIETPKVVEAPKPVVSKPVETPKPAENPAPATPTIQTNIAASSAPAPTVTPPQVAQAPIPTVATNPAAVPPSNPNPDPNATAKAVTESPVAAPDKLAAPKTEITQAHAAPENHVPTVAPTPTPPPIQTQTPTPAPSEKPAESTVAKNEPVKPPFEPPMKAQSPPKPVPPLAQASTTPTAPAEPQPTVKTRTKAVTNQAFHYDPTQPVAAAKPPVQTADAVIGNSRSKLLLIAGISMFVLAIGLLYTTLKRMRSTGQSLITRSMNAARK